MKINSKSLMAFSALIAAILLLIMNTVFAQGDRLGNIKRSSGLNKGTINNIVICVGFSDKYNFLNSANELEEILNGVSATSKSVKNYYKTVSYNQLTVNSHICPTQTAGASVFVYKDYHTRNYYRSIVNAPDSGWVSYENGGYERLEGLIKRAFISASADLSTTTNFDADNDGYIDNAAIIISGKSETFNDVLYPICGTSTANVTVNGKKFGVYNILFEEDLTVGVMCHEFFHTIGAPDLYHYKESYKYLKPVDRWDLMGEEGNQNMTAFMKWKYGKWISRIPEITASGNYTLKNLGGNDTNNICYKISSPKSTKEYFMLEYRRQEDLFESYIPSSGLLIYRVSTVTDGSGNRNYPDSPDEVYVMRPDGSASSAGIVDNAAFSSDNGRTTFSDKSNPADVFSDGIKGGITISNIGALGETISFRVNLNLTPPAAEIIAFPPEQVYVGEEVTIKTRAIDSEEDSVRIRVSWGDGDTTAFGMYYASGEEATFKHIYTRAGTYQIRDEAEDEHDWEGEWSQPTTIQVINSPETNEIKGKVIYSNSSSTPLNNVKVLLRNSTGTVDTAITDTTGNYIFTGKEADTYSFSVLSSLAWGGVNSTDALQIRRYLSGLTQFDSLQVKAADVNRSGMVNSTDALLIRRRTSGLDTTFTGGNWAFENPSIIYEGGSLTVNIKGLCAGDVNGSYIPGSVRAANKKK